MLYQDRYVRQRQTEERGRDGMEVGKPDERLTGSKEEKRTNPNFGRNAPKFVSECIYLFKPDQFRVFFWLFLSVPLAVGVALGLMTRMTRMAWDGRVEKGWSWAFLLSSLPGRAGVLVGGCRRRRGRSRLGKSPQTLPVLFLCLGGQGRTRKQRER